MSFKNTFLLGVSSFLAGWVGQVVEVSKGLEASGMNQLISSFEFVSSVLAAFAKIIHTDNKI